MRKFNLTEDYGDEEWPIGEYVLLSEAKEALLSDGAVEAVADKLAGAEPEHDIGDLAFEIAQTISAALGADTDG